MEIEFMQNRTIFHGDNLPILRNMETATIDLIYLDPPFNKKKIFTAAAGSAAEGAAFSDIFRPDDIDTAWLKEIKKHAPAVHGFLCFIENTDGRESYNFCYLAYMGIRLLECYRVLKESGALHLHCDPTMSHYLKLLLDCVFGEEHFCNEIVWAYKSGGANSKRFAKKHDIILFYRKSDGFVFRPLKEKSYNREFKQYNFKGVEEFKDDARHFADGYGWYTEVNMKDVFSLDMVGRSSGERTGYPTQKPLGLLRRLVETCSDAGDMVLDPCFGSGTALLAAEDLGRQWAGIDASAAAVALLTSRLAEAGVDAGSLHVQKTL